MNTEAFGYAVLSALVGMAIVFLFLVVLSVIMVVLRKMLDDPAGDNARSDGGPVAHTERTEPSAEDGLPPWVVAGVMAYLSAEEQHRAPHAGTWTKRGRQ